MTDDRVETRTPPWAHLWVWIVGMLLAMTAFVGVLNLVFGVPDANVVTTMPVHRVQDPEFAFIDVPNGGCVSSANVFHRMPDLGAVDVQVALTPWVHGWIDGVFYGTLEEAVGALGGTEIAIGPNEIWFRTGPASAESIQPLRTPLGRVVWMPGNATARANCGPVT